MKDLLSLDSVVTTQTSRPVRKQQVIHIQDVMKDVEAIQSKLKALQDKIRFEKAEYLKKLEAEQKKKLAAEKEAAEKAKREEAKEKEKKEKREKERKEAEAKAVAAREAARAKASDKEKEEEDTDEKMVLAPVPSQPSSLSSLWENLQFSPEFHVDESQSRY